MVLFLDIQHHLISKQSSKIHWSDYINIRLHVAQSANDMSATSMLLWNTEKGEETLNFLEEAKAWQKGQLSEFQLWIMLVNFAPICFDWKQNMFYPQRDRCMHVEDSCAKIILFWMS